MTKQIKTGRVLKSQLNDSAADVSATVALSAQGLPDYLIEIGNVDTTKIDEAFNVLADADTTKDFAPLTFGMTIRSVLGATLFERFPRIGSKRNDRYAVADYKNVPTDKVAQASNNFDLYEPKADKPKSGTKSANKNNKNKKGRPAALRSRVRDMVERELKGGRDLVAKVTEYKKIGSDDGLSDTAKDTNKSNLGHWTARLNKYVRRASDAIKFVQVLDDIHSCPTLSVLFYVTDDVPADGELAFYVPDDYPVQPGMRIDHRKKAPIKLFDMETVKAGTPAAPTNQTSVSVGELLRCNIHAVNGRVTVKSFLETGKRNTGTKEDTDTETDTDASVFNTVDDFADTLANVVEFACGEQWKFNADRVAKDQIGARLRSRSEADDTFRSDMFKMLNYLRAQFNDEALRDRAVTILSAQDKANKAATQAAPSQNGKEAATA